MPIPKEVFETGAKTKADAQITRVIVRFLKKNKARAYNTQDLVYALQKPYANICRALSKLTAKNILQRKLIGQAKYYMINEDKKEVK